ncbi:MAG: DUF4336 domain-containing protein [Myxococcota bacterium]
MIRSVRMLTELASNLWVTERPLHFGGLNIGTRMTVVRLAGGELFLHSPVLLDPELREELDGLGRVRYVVAPNKMHHLFVGEYGEGWPNALLYCAPGLETKRKDIDWHETLGDTAPEAWRGQLKQVLFAGFPIANEVVFFHPPTRTLFVTDIAFHVGEESPVLTRFAFRLLGAYKRFGPSLMERLLIRDRAAARASLETILAWDFERVIVTHGSVVEYDGPEALRKSYEWL